eukprot:TRINITY_DN614_c0_g2_i1.p1 TRINITY_DN614_c0_g2~~TRINITY_DN614_c0_g2_i1.p1  ORF type:complete len:282 (+),score=128.84 TRINITY_DN614_c0_g2_i1:54-899(+)
MMRTALLFAAVAAATALEPHTILPANLEAAALHQLYAAYGAYCKEAKLTAWDCKWCKYIGVEKVYGVVSNVKHDGQAFVVRTNLSEIIVSFRGSHNIPNWVSDLTFDKVHLKWDGVPSNIEVHQGFLHSYEALQTDVNTWVKQAVADCANCTIHITGHSLGAAQAVLCVTDLRLQGMKPEMWNFGLPRVGGKAFATWFDGLTTANNQTVFRMVNKKDMVPHLPPPATFYHHVATEVWRVPKNGSYVVCDGSGEDPKCSKSVWDIEESILAHLSYMGLEESC